MASEIKVDTISEKTSANGVTIDGVSLKDSKIATANSVDSDAYVDGSIDTAHIDALQVTGAKLNTDVISAQTELAAEPADADEFMVSDGGVLKRIDYSLIKGGTNTPNFFAYNPASQTMTKDAETAVIMASEAFDSASAYNTSDGKFTVPAGEGGVYWFKGAIRMVGTAAIPTRASSSIYVNGAVSLSNELGGSGGLNTYSYVAVYGILNLSASDYVQLYFYHDASSDMDLSQASIHMGGFQGFKLIG